MVVFQKIFSAIMALIMSFFSFVLPPADNTPLPSRGDVISTGSNSRPNVNAPVICRSYIEFELFCKASNSKKLDRYVDLFDKELFDDYCVVAFHIEVPDPSYSVYLNSADYTDGRTLEVRYTRVSYPYVSASVISYDTVILLADKAVRNVKIYKEEDMHLNIYPADTDYFVFSIAQVNPVYPYYPENEGCFESCFIFEDYESWSDFRDNGNWKLSRFFDIAADESFFERNNLVVAITTLSSGAYRVCFSDAYENGDKAEIELFKVHEQGIHPDVINYAAALVAVGKDIKTADASYTMLDVPFQLDCRVDVNLAYLPNWAYPPDAD